VAASSNSSWFVGHGSVIIFYATSRLIAANANA